MSGLVITKAQAEDDFAISQLLIESFVTTYARKMPEVVVSEKRKEDLRDIASKRRDYSVWVGKLEDKLVVTGTLFLPGTKGNEAWLPNAAGIKYVAASLSHQGRGLADPLMERLEQEAWQSGVDSICLHVRKGAVGVARFYERRGYVRAVEGDLDRLPEIYLMGYIKTRTYPHLKASSH